jgi:hypothetical protein
MSIKEGKMKSSFICLLALMVSFIGCNDTMNTENNGNNSYNYLESIIIAGNIIEPGDSGANIAAAEIVTVTLAFIESFEVTPFFK